MAIIDKPGLYVDVRRDIGVYFDMPEHEYRQDPAPEPSLNQSLIPALLDRSPFHAAYECPRLNPYGRLRLPSRAQIFGETVHRLALGRGREISTVRYRDYTSSSARDDRDEALRNNRIPVLEHQYLAAHEIATIVRERMVEACEGHPYQTEVVLIWKERTVHGEIYCRAQVDVWCEALGLALDPKILSTPATPFAFGRAAADGGYDLQAVFYGRGFGQLMPQFKGSVRFANLVVESYPPFATQSFAPDQNTRYVAERRCAQAMELWARCLKERAWPSYPRGIQSYETPSFHQQRIINS